jgi:GNAT superfamily N-acetyltransferase
MGNPRPLPRLPRLLPQKLFIVREHLNLTQTAIKDSLYLSTSARISEYENGKRRPPLMITLGYSRLAQVSMESLVIDGITLNAFRKQLPTLNYKELNDVRNRAIQPVGTDRMNVTNYMVQPPLSFGHHYQQIRVTVEGTPQIAGLIEISSSGRGSAYISNLRVHQEHRRRGVAAKLIDAVINTARHQGFEIARLEARPFGNGISLEELVAMYRRQGFRSVGNTRRGSPLMELKL